MPKKEEATLEVTVDGDYAIYTWTGSDGGWLFEHADCRDMYVSAGIGSGTFRNVIPCSGEVIVQLQSSKGAKVLAETTYTA